MKTKELTNVPGLNAEDKVTIKKYNYGEKTDLANISTQVGVIQGRETASVSVGKYKLYALVYAITQAPFFEGKKTEDDKYNAIRALEPDTGDFIFKEIQALNTTSIPEEIKKK